MYFRCLVSGDSVVWWNFVILNPRIIHQVEYDNHLTPCRVPQFNCTNFTITLRQDALNHRRIPDEYKCTYLKVKFNLKDKFNHI